MLGLSFVAVGRFCRRSFASASFVFALQALSSLVPMSFSSCGDFFGSPRTPGLPLVLPPSLQKGGLWLWCVCVWGGGSRDALVLLPEGLSSPPARFWSSGRGGGASGRSLGARELASVSSVHSWTGDPGVALLRRDSCYPLCPGWLSLLISARPAR